MYRIGEFSKMAKLTVKTLRFYEEAGLLKPEFTDEETNYRYYASRQLYCVQQIVALRQAGFSVSEIRRVLSGENVEMLLETKLTELTHERQLAEQRPTRLNVIKKFYTEDRKMTYQAIVKDLPQYTVYYRQFKVRDFSEYGSIIPETGAKIAAANPDLKCAVPEYCYVEYLDGEYKERDFNVEYAEAVEKAGTETEDIKFKVLPPVQAACVMHKGSYEGLRKAYGYLMTWVDENGYAAAGNAREQYIDGCWNRESEDDYLTEVQIPVTRR